MEEGFTHQTGLVKMGTDSNYNFTISQKVKTFPLHGKIVGSIPTSQICAQHMLYSSNRLGSIPLKDKIWVRVPYRVPAALIRAII